MLLDLLLLLAADILAILIAEYIIHNVKTKWWKQVKTSFMKYFPNHIIKL